MQDLYDGAWYPGLDSISFELGQGQYQWGQNIVNRGGMIGTRQGFAQIVGKALVEQSQDKPRGICLFSTHTVGVDPYIVVAIGNKVYKLAHPYTGNLIQIPNINFPTSTRYVHFEVCVQAQKTDSDGNVVDITPRFVLMMMDGVTNPAYWFFDGNTSKSGHTNPNATPQDPVPWNTPVGTHLKWAGSRLWVGAGNKLKASDLLNPLQFEEQKTESGGGFFFLPGTITAMGVTHDYKALLVFTDQTTSAFQVGIEERNAWVQTQDFQRVLFPGVGCVSHRTFINQYGMSWWMSHDGVVGLDSTLQAYQTSRMQVRDHNMSRSKEGVNWKQGGGCAGSFGNWLFFSVPSGSKYNVHTWVMDQAVQQNINTITPPAWCSNWTGIRPEQWVTGTVNGEQRCFCLSYDVVPDGHQATIWEAFIGQRMDVPKTGPNQGDPRAAKDIGCAFETRFMGLAPSQYMKLRYVQLDLAEIVGNVRLQVYYCGRRTSYKKILDKKITAQVTPATEILFDPDQLINIYVPQYRTVKAVTDSHDSDDADTGIQTPYLRNIDRSFSLLVTWTGQMSITGLRMCVDPISMEYGEGECEVDETTIRRITAEGTGQILTDLAPPNNYLQGPALQSKYLAPLRPRWVEFPSYDAAAPNGVFFVDIPQFAPAPGGYPLSDYSPFKDITLSNETIGDTIVFTTDGTVPRLTPLRGTIYDATHHPHITQAMLPATVKARGFRDGMLPSAVAVGHFVQARVATPVLSPAPDGYALADYPKTVTITCATPSSTIRYVRSTDANAHVTPTSPVYIAPLVVQANQYLRAKAFKAQYLDSAEGGGRYTIEPQCATPTLTPDAGHYPDTDYPKTITIATSTQGAGLRWRLNNPDVQHGIHVDAQLAIVTVNEGDTLYAIAQKTGLLDSDVKSALYQGPTSANRVAEPTMSPDGGEFENDFVVITFHCSTPDATMAYNVGLASDPPPDPTHSQTERRVSDGDEITLNIGHKIVKVIAFKSGMDDSVIHSAEFDHVHGGGGGR